MKNYIIVPGKLNGYLFGPYYGGVDAPEPVNTAAIIEAQNQAAMQAAEQQAQQFEQMQEYQREREAFALSQRDNETQIAMMEQAIQEGMESILAGEIEEQTEAEEGGQMNVDFTSSLLDALTNYTATAVPDNPATGGGLTGSDPNNPGAAQAPNMGGGSVPGRPI